MKISTMLVLLLMLMHGMTTADPAGQPTDSEPINQTIAVLRFSNLSNRVEAGKMFSKQISTALSERGVRVLPTDETASLLDEVGLSNIPVDREIAQQLGRGWGVRYILYGSVIEYQYLRRSEPGLKEPVVGITARLVDVDTGRIVWAFSGSAAHPETAMESIDALTSTAHAVAKQAVKELMGRMRVEQVNPEKKKG